MCACAQSLKIPSPHTLPYTHALSLSLTHTHPLTHQTCRHCASNNQTLKQPTQITKTLTEQVSKYAQVVLDSAAYAGSGNVLKVQELLALCGEHIETEEGTAWKVGAGDGDAVLCCAVSAALVRLVIAAAAAKPTTSPVRDCLLMAPQQHPTPFNIFLSFLVGCAPQLHKPHQHLTPPVCLRLCRQAVHQVPAVFLLLQWPNH